MKKDFQAGVDKIYDACVEAGSTPSSKTPDGLVSAISNLSVATPKTKYSGNRYSGSGSLGISYTAEKTGILIGVAIGAGPHLNLSSFKATLNGTNLTKKYDDMGQTIRPNVRIWMTSVKSGDVMKISMGGSATAGNTGTENLFYLGGIIFAI